MGRGARHASGFRAVDVGDGTRAGSDLAWVQNPIVFMSDYDDPTIARTYWSAAEGPTGWTRFDTVYGQITATDRSRRVRPVDRAVSRAHVVDELFGDPSACSGDWSPPRCQNSAVGNYTVRPLWEGVHTVTRARPT